MEQKKNIKGYTIFIDRKLGEGAFGKVYIGEHDETKKRVAIKAIARAMINRDPYIKNALFSEIDILKSLKSPNIVGFLEVMESDNYYYIIQYFCNGGDLKGVMDKRKRIPEAEAIQMLTQICNGFVELIKEGIIHRDLKPENILINQGVLKLADFGFSKRTSNARMKNQTMVGTPLYMSVQILKGQPYTSKCDIWALGLIFYELMCGRTPWDGNSEYELINNIERRPIQFPEYISQVSRDFISRCCKVHYKDRFSWDELLRHPIFNGRFTNYEKGGEITYENKYKSLMRDLRLKIKLDNIDLYRLFKRMNFNKTSELSLQDFQKFLETVSNNFTADEAKYIFERLDADKSNTITMIELENEMKKYNIPMQSAVKELPSYNRKHSKEGDQKKHDEKAKLDLQAKINKNFLALADMLERDQITLPSYFAQFDKSKDGVLKKEEFFVLLKAMGFPFEEKEMSYLFKVIDNDRSGTITYGEFYKFYCKVIGEPVQQFGGISPKQNSPRQTPIQMPQQQMGQFGYQQPQQFGVGMGNMQGMGGMGGMGGMMPDPLLGMMMNGMPGMGGMGGMQGIGGMGLGGLGGGLPMGVGMQPYQQNQGMMPNQQQMNAGFQQGQNRRFPGMPAFTGNGWDF